VRAIRAAAPHMAGRGGGSVAMIASISGSRPGPRAQYGPSYYAAYLADPDGYRVEVVSGGS